MKVFLLTKKTLLLILSIITAFIITLSIFLTFCSASSKNPEISNNLMKKIVEYSNEEEKIAYLTFDDGPTASVTPKILDILKEENIKATFFVIGKYVDAHPDIVKRAYEEGHYIASHSYNHNNSVLYKSSESFINEIKKTDLAIGNAIGVQNYCSHLFRFPNGFMSSNYRNKKNNAANLLSQMDYYYLDWNCLNNDAIKKCSNIQLLKNLKSSCKNQNVLVVLMHDTKDVNNSSFVLKDSISYLRSQGYKFGELSSIFENK